MERGVVFSIEEFGVNDGPGLRTVVFLKGCPLKCVWCHNPEGIAFEPQYLVKKTGRTLCGYVIDATELAEKILKNKSVFNMGNGGVTLSGGEPLAQPGFVKEFLAQTASIHRAVETSGYAPTEVFRSVVDLTDLVLFDIKHMDTEKHKQYTGVGNEQILKNLDYLCGADKPFVVRIALIPGVNDDEENMSAILSRIKDAGLLQRVELLPYNKLAGAKYTMLGQMYDPPFDPLREPHITNIFNNHNIKTIVL